MRGPEEHPDPAPDPAPDPSLVSGDPPADPPEFTPPADQAALDALIKDAVEKAQPAPLEPLAVESLTLPEGMEFPEGTSEKFLEILNGEQSPQDRANALLALYGEQMRNAQEADSKAWDNMQDEWKKEVKADSDIGGDKLQPTLNNIGKLVNEFGTDELKQVFDSTGAGNNIHVIKFLNKIAGALTEGNFFKSSTPPTGGNSEEEKARRLYPSMNK